MPGGVEAAACTVRGPFSIRLLRRTMTISTADDRSSDAAFIVEIDELVRHWLDVAAARGEDRSAKRLAALLKDPAGLDFTVAFVDRVVRPEDVRVAAASLRELAAHPPRFLSWYLRLGLRVRRDAGKRRPGRRDVRCTRRFEIDGGPPSRRRHRRPARPRCRPYPHTGGPAQFQPPRRGCAGGAGGQYAS